MAIPSKSRRGDIAVFEAKDTNFEARVRDSFAAQIIAHTMGLELRSVIPGEVVLEMPFNPNFVQQHGFHHAGATTTALDSACGYAAFSLMPAGAEVLTVEFKTSLMAPAAGAHFRFEGRVVKPGRTLMFTQGDAFAISDGQEKLIAQMSATMMVIEGREGINR